MFIAFLKHCTVRGCFKIQGAIRNVLRKEDFSKNDTNLSLYAFISTYRDLVWRGVMNLTKESVPISLRNCIYKRLKQ